MRNIHIKKRCSNILYHLISLEDFVSISNLSKSYNVSTRTIRYDLDKIDNFLQNNKLPQLIRKPNLGVKFDTSCKEKQKTLDLLKERNSSNYIPNSEDREKVILSELFLAEGYITSVYLASLLNVSRGTIKNDLKKVKEWLSNYYIELNTYPGYGIKIVGNEESIREAIVALLYYNIEITEALKIIKEPLLQKGDINFNLYNLFSDLDIEYIERIVKLSEKWLNIFFSDRAFSNITIYLILAIKRIKQDKNINLIPNELKKLKMTKEFAVASSMIKYLEDYFKVNISNNEIYYITILILGSKKTQDNTYLKEDWCGLHKITAELIENVSAEIKLNLLEDDELYKGLIKHLGPSIYRLKHGLLLSNPIINEIKNNYYLLFKIVKKELKNLENYIKCTIPDEEIGYITLHFGAALERSKKIVCTKYRILLVCNTGIGNSKLLTSRIKAEFANIEIVDVIAERQLSKKYKYDNIDFIISIVATDYKELPVLLVNPLLLQQDILIIKEYIKQYTPKEYLYKNIVNTTSLVGDLFDIINRNCEIKFEDTLIKEIKEYFNLAMSNS